ncbi:MAG: hypothetical protein AAGH41_00515 [Pseudomonadota bacterium]
MKHRWAVAALALAACETVDLPEGLTYARAFDARPDSVGTIISTAPVGAVLTHPGGVCRTPCQVTYPELVQVLVAKEGYAPLKLNIPVGAKDTAFELTPVGRSVAVEEVTLPEL